MEKEQAEIKAGEVIRSVVDLLSKRQYNKLETAAKMEALTCEEVRELVDGYLELNELSQIDPFDAECSFRPKYEYHQMNFYHYKNGSGFKADYDLTTDSELNDLTLQMEFIYEENDGLSARLLDLHVL